jgi:hypothetical protein
MMINDKVYEKLTTKKVIEIIDNIRVNNKAVYDTVN